MHALTVDELIARKIQESPDLDALALTLQHLLNDGYSVWTDGKLLSTRQRVAQIHGLVLEVYPREHPPPHFHVRGGDVNASFSILECSLLEGCISRKDHELVKWWHSRARAKLIAVWNATRPTDCAVGPIIIDAAT